MAVRAGVKEVGGDQLGRCAGTRLRKGAVVTAAVRGQEAKQDRDGRNAAALSVGSWRPLLEPFEWTDGAEEGTQCQEVEQTV